MNLPVAVVSQPSSAAENPQSQFADMSLDNDSINISENIDSPAKSDKSHTSSQTQHSANTKETFSEKYKKALATAENPAAAETDSNADPAVSQQNDDVEAAVSALIETTDSTLEQPELIIPADSAEMPDISATNSIAVLPIETTILPSASEEISIPADSGISQTSFPAQSDSIKTNLADSGANKTITQNVFEKYNEAGVEAGNKNLQNSSAVKPAENLIAASDTQDNQTATTKNLNLTTDTKAVDIKSETLESLPQSTVATKDSAAANTVDAAAKEQTAVSTQNFAQKVGVPQPQTNAENSNQTLFEQSFSSQQGSEQTYQKTDNIESISLENKNSGDLQTPPIQEMKTAEGSEKISSPTATDLKTDIKQETGEISRQIADSIKSAINSSEKQITVRLNPAELGKVVIKISGEHSQISTIIEASNPDTKSQLQEAFGQVAKNLADAGITVRHFEVRSTEQSSGRFESAFSQNNQSGQSGNSPAWQFSQSQNPTEGGFYYQNQNFGIKNSSSEQNFSQNHFNARSVNMLA